MEIHKPKPVHTLREFLSEVAVVVVGIVIALSADQALQSLEWRHRVRLADEQIRQEIAGDDGPQIFERVALAPCIKDALYAIRNSIEQGAPRATVLETINRLCIPRHTWDSVAFQASNSSGVLGRLAAERIGLLSYFYSFMPALDRANEREFHDVAILRAISGAGGALTETEQARVLEGVEILRTDDAEILGLATLSSDAMKLLDIKPGDSFQSGRTSLRQPERVIVELESVPMAERCMAPLRQLLGVAP